MMLRLLLFFAWCALPLRAATVLLTVTGRVSETDAASFFPNLPVTAGQVWTTTMEYYYPTAGEEILGSWNYYDPLGRLTFTVNGHTWGGTGIGAGLGGLFFQANLAASTAAPAGLVGPGRNSSVVLTWHGPESMIIDRSSLPQSFADWNLPSADSFELEVRTGIGQPGSVWLIKANSYDTMTIQVIPEPSAAGFALAIAIAGLTRRRKK